jgi:hypothetical protein
MNIKTRPLLIAAGVGAVVQVLYSLLSNAVSLAPMLSGQGLDLTQPSNLSLVTGALACICTPVIGIGAGLLYAYLHGREAALTVADGAIGGAATGAIIQLIGGILGACLSLLVVPQVLQQATAQVPPEAAGIALGAGIAGGIIGAAIGICIGLAIGAILGAIGGAIGGAVLGKSSPTMPPAPGMPA